MKYFNKLRCGMGILLTSLTLQSLALASTPLNSSGERETSAPNQLVCGMMYTGESTHTPGPDVVYSLDNPDEVVAGDSVVQYSITAGIKNNEVLGMIQVKISGLEHGLTLKQMVTGVVSETNPLLFVLEGVKGKTPTGEPFDGILISCSIDD